MKEITTPQLEVWSEGGNIEEKVYFIVIKTPNCIRCEQLKRNAEKAFGNMLDTVGWYTFKPGETIAAKIFSNLGITSAPAVIYRYQENGQWKKGALIGDFDDQDCTDLRCMFDAIAENDQAYFGYNEFDEPIEEDPRTDMNRLLRLIYGEADPNVIKERQKFKKDITN